MSDLDWATWLTLAEVVEWGRSRGPSESFSNFLATLYELCCSGRVCASGRRWMTGDVIEPIPPSEWADLWFDSDGQGFRSHDLFSGIERRHAWTEIQFSRDDLIAHWPQSDGTAGEKALAEQYWAKRHRAERRTEWRRQWIERFAGRQRVLRQWIALPEITDWCARSVTGSDAAAEERARTLAYQRLDRSARNGEFDGQRTNCSRREAIIPSRKSKILYLDPLMTASGHTAGCRLTREGLAQLSSIRDLAARCWLPRALAQQWIVAHGYPWPAHFDKSTSTGESSPEPMADVAWPDSGIHTNKAAADTSEQEANARVDVATGLTPKSDYLRPASYDEIDFAITAVYDEAAQIGGKPPNIKELSKPVQAKLAAIGRAASGALIMEIGDRQEHKKRRRRPGKTIASEKRKADFTK